MSDPEEPAEKTVAEDTDDGLGAMAFAGLRLMGVFAVIVTLAGIIYALPGLFHGAELGEETVSVGFLIVVPFCLGALVSLLADPDGTQTTVFHVIVVPLILSVIITGVAFGVLKEGAICIAMLLPLWIVLLALGGFMVHSFHKQFHSQSRMNATLLASLAALAAAIGPQPFSTPQDYRFERSIVIAAAPDDIWPHLESLTGLQPGDGRWTVTHNLLGVPRPVAARLDGLVRFAEWEDGLMFEEHVTRQVPGRAIDWNFVFPDPTLHHHVDRHINPDGRQLDVRRGGYRLEPLADGRTRLTLYTEFRLDTQMNAYPALWARFMLGEIQGNILGVIRDRVEAD